MTRYIWIWIGLWSVAVAGGCAGDLDNADAFNDEPPEAKSAEEIFAESCGLSGCHDDSASPAMGLDLLSPGVEGRLVDVDATGVTCGNPSLVVAGSPDSSHLFDMVLGNCVIQMPPLPLPADEIEILRQWIEDLGGS